MMMMMMTTTTTLLLSLLTMMKTETESFAKKIRPQTSTSILSESALVSSFSVSEDDKTMLMGVRRTTTRRVSLSVCVYRVAAFYTYIRSHSSPSLMKEGGLLYRIAPMSATRIRAHTQQLEES
ncbi:hypothetical protein Ac2012v2_006672 [Leucoagaricus gongylophorus]